MMTLRSSVAALLTLTVLSGPGSLAEAPADAPLAAPPKTIKIEVSPYMAWAPIHIAQAEGCFREAGLDVEYVTMRGDREGLPAVVQGRLDVLAGFIRPSYFNLIGRGANIRFVADKGHVEDEGCSYRAFLARRELVESGALASLDGIRGLRLSGEKTALSFYGTSHLLAKAGVLPEEVVLIHVPTAAKLDAFRTGAIDIANTSEPWVTRIIRASDAVLWLPDHEVTPGFQHSFILFGPRLLETDRDAGRKFMVGYLRGVRIYNQGKTDRNVRIVAEATGLDEELVRATCWPPVRNSGEIDTASMSEYQQWAFEQGLIDSVIPVERFWDPSFIEHANHVLRGE